jgi:hypothetical protein
MKKERQPWQRGGLWNLVDLLDASWDSMLTRAFVYALGLYFAHIIVLRVLAYENMLPVEWAEYWQFVKPNLAPIAGR